MQAIDPISSNMIFPSTPTNTAAKTTEVSTFEEILQTKSIAQTDTASSLSLESMLKAKYPDLYYHVFDANQISPSTWNRADFPFENFFSDDVDYDAIKNWEPSGPEPSAASTACQERYASVLPNKKSVVIPPALQKKMDADPALAEKVMNTLEQHFSSQYACCPGCDMSCLVTLREDGTIGNWTTVVDGSGLIQTTNKEEDPTTSYLRAMGLGV